MAGFPIIRPVGLAGLLVSFSDRMTDQANRAAIAFSAAVEGERWSGIEEISTSLVSVFLRIDPLAADLPALTGRVEALAASRDWLAAPLPSGRRHWAIPTVYGTDLAPELDEAARAAGISPEAAVADLSSTRVRVLTFGFAPGQPYLGQLPERWNLPRRTELNPSVPQSALVVAVRQLVLFSRPTPTGWRHVGQTAFENFRPGAGDPFPLRPGDELSFPAVSAEEFADIRASGDPDGGATVEEIA